MDPVYLILSVVVTCVINIFRVFSARSWPCHPVTWRTVLHGSVSLPPRVKVSPRPAWPSPQKALCATGPTLLTRHPPRRSAQSWKGRSVLVLSISRWVVLCTLSISRWVVLCWFPGALYFVLCPSPGGLYFVHFQVGCTCPLPGGLYLVHFQVGPGGVYFVHFQVGCTLSTSRWVVLCPLPRGSRWDVLCPLPGGLYCVHFQVGCTLSTSGGLYFVHFQVGGTEGEVCTFNVVHCQVGCHCVYLVQTLTCNCVYLVQHWHVTVFIWYNTDMWLCLFGTDTDM